ncbi:MAG: histidinol dehydrogenase, partial [bacterium]|nr:histidinol dehydrogenase [bacterium]
LAAAAIAGATGVLAAGGAHAVAALAFGAGDLRPCDVVVGPGNRWVTAAKQLVSGRVGIDMLAGPSELVVIADETADPDVIAADLLAQAEHDADALPVLVTPDNQLAIAVEQALVQQLACLPTGSVAAQALDNGFAVVTKDLNEAISVCDTMAPEHLQVMCAGADDVASRCRHWGGLFIGSGTAEVLGDYGAGPNHTLPTGGVARFKGGLSVFDFLRIRTWLKIDDSEQARSLMSDAADLARMEGLEGHARAAEARLKH